MTSTINISNDKLCLRLLQIKKEDIGLNRQEKLILNKIDKQHNFTRSEIFQIHRELSERKYIRVEVLKVNNAGEILEYEYFITNKGVEAIEIYWSSSETHNQIKTKRQNKVYAAAKIVSILSIFYGGFFTWLNYKKDITIEKQEKTIVKFSNEVDSLEIVLKKLKEENENTAPNTK